MEPIIKDPIKGRLYNMGPAKKLTDADVVPTKKKVKNCKSLVGQAI